MLIQDDRQGHRSTEGLYGVPVGMARACVPVPAGGPATEGGVMTLAQLIELFDARIVATYTPAQYRKECLRARADRVRWGIGQW